ncbi:LTA synthase family protein [Companilactobacillus allii]|uniref:Glycerol phosphate lipoteichoic acid synthase n=1 Tax=Companilactobacillus allii TaxID=1847728 RepID=A0A1P8Q3K2_9LACO|nr:LTA synthase family protein [Companilactobacillus allii]APX72403.1 glycerol phosphate lipoteichoic acid synthase [Companilactobacillus allii]USQ69496.1 LTA synthase family protein [Companilactobacillus allii]
MKRIFKGISNFLNTRLGFVILAVLLYTMKTVYAYTTKFNLGVKGSIQTFLMIINPIPIMLLLFGIALYMKGRKSYIFLLIVDFLDTVWLFSNILYYREFSDFLTMVLIKGSGSVSNNLGKSILGIVRPTDFLVFIDVLVLVLLLAFHVIKMDIKRMNWRIPVLISTLAVLLFGANLTLAESDRSQLLTRTFDNNYIVKYLGLNVFNIYDVVKTSQTNAVKAKAKSSDLDSIEKYMKSNYATPNVEYTGVAKGKNVFVIHLESLQQFMIDYKWDGEEVTPNLNKIYHEDDTLSFDNFFNQVGQGKTADAELMLENSLFGLPEGSAMVTDGTSNTFQAAPAILDQQGYTTASFHGDVPSFWNRDNAYKSWGYDYFFSSNYYKIKKDYNVGYGMKDKIFLKDSAKYIEQLPQPFYAKLITVTNHYPYTLDKKNQSISKTDTGDKTVDGYVQTARYLDESIGEFMNWLKETGLDKTSMVVLYGDHYGISDNHKKAMAKLTGIKGFDDFDNAQYQRVPFIIHMDGLKGGINHTYGGEIDVLPTILNLLGVSDKNTIQFGSDLLSKEHSQVVAFRNGDFVTPKVTKVGSTFYNTKTGKVDKNISSTEKAKLSNKVTTELSLSDRVINGDLLRFHKLPGFTKVNKKDYSYKKSTALKKLKAARKKDGTSILAQNDNKSLLDLYTTDAPELNNDK